MNSLAVLLLIGLAYTAYGQNMSGNGSTPAGPKKAPPSIGGVSFNPGGIKMKDLKNLGEGALGNALKSMSQTEQDDVCLGVMLGGASKKTMDEIKAAGVDCTAALGRNPGTKKIPKAQQKLLLEQKLASNPVKNWNAADAASNIKAFGDSMKASDLKGFSASVAKELFTSGAFGDLTLGKKQKAALGASAIAAFGSASSWSASTVKTMSSSMGFLAPKDIKNIPDSAIGSAAAELAKQTFEPSMKARLGKKILKSMSSDPTAWSATDASNAIAFMGPSRKDLLSKLPLATLKSALGDIGARKMSPKEARAIADALKKDPVYASPSTMTSSQLEDAGSVVSGMGASFFKNLPKAAISGAISKLANLTFTKSQARALMNTVKGDIASITASKIKEYGSLITGLNSEDMNNIPGTVIADAIEDLAEKDFKMGPARVIISKALAANASSVTKMGALFASAGTPSDISAISIDDLGLACLTSTAPSITPNTAMAKSVFKKIKADARFGAVNANAANYSLSCFENWGAFAFLGMDIDDITNLPDNGDIGSIFAAACGFQGKMSDAQNVAWAGRVKTWIDINNSTAMASSDNMYSAKILNIGCFIPYFNDTEKMAFPSSLQPDIVSEMSGASSEMMSLNTVRMCKNHILKYVPNADTGVAADRTSVAALDQNDVVSLGSCQRGLEAAEINKLDADSIAEYLADIGPQLRALLEKTTMWDRAVSQDSTFLDSCDNMISGAGIVDGMSSTRLASVSKSTSGECLSEIAGTVETVAAMHMLRDVSFSNEISAADRTTMATNVAAFILKAFDGYLSAGSSKRRRRTTTTITCSDVTLLGSNAASLSTTQIASLTTAEFTDCTEGLGAITTWSSAQMTTLTAEAKAAYGSTVSTWSPDDIQNIGTINAGLTDTEIGTLNITSAETLSVLATYPSLTSSQLAAGYSRYKTNVLSGTASATTGNDLLTLGAFTCGASTTDIGTFTNANYMIGASTIGTQTGCSASQLTAYATKAKSAYGASSTWDSTTMTTVGGVIGGLTAAEIGALTSAQMSSISPSSIAIMPPSSFAALSASQLSALSTAQANAVSSTQKAALSSAQLSSLSESAGPQVTPAPVVTPAGGSASAVTASVLIMLAPILAHLYL